MPERTSASPTAAPTQAARSGSWVRLAVVPLIAGIIIGLAIGSGLDVAPGGVPRPRITLTETAYEASACRTTPTDDPLAQDGMYHYRVYNVTLTLSNAGNADGFAHVRIRPDSETPRNYFVPWDSQVTKTPVVQGSTPFRSFDECNSSQEAPQISLIGYYKADPQVALTDTTFEPDCTDSPPYIQVYRFAFVLVNPAETDAVAVVSFHVYWRHVGEVHYFVPRLSQISKTAEMTTDRSLVDGSSFESSRECHLVLSWVGSAHIWQEGT